MLRNLLLTFGLIFTTSLYMYAQQGALQGKVIDKKTKKPIPFANIILVHKGTQVGGTTSDFNGNYQIKPIPPGKYELKATFVGYQTVVIPGIPIAADKIRFYNIKMTATTKTLATVEIVTYKVPLISKDETATGATITAEEVARMPRRSANAVATTVGGVFSANGERGSVRGARTNATTMYIDGVKVIGSASVPESAIEQVDVVLGGLPAQYGDATSGIINVTTKGPSRQFGAGIELETSELLDAFGHNRLGFDFMGPLIKGKNRNNTSLLGFFISGDLIYNQDGAPAITGHYYAKDNVLNYLKKTPLRYAGLGTGTFPNAAYIGSSDIEYSKSSKNTARYSINILGNINVRTTKTIQLTFGGSVYAYQGRRFSYSGSMFNYDKNALTKNATYRGYVRFTQRFPTDVKSKTIFKNFYYTLQFDYTKTKNEFGDANHWKDLFKYGYLGKFTTYKKPTYQLGSDTINGHYYKNVYLLNSWDFDTLTSWKPEKYNPLIAEYTTNYYNIFAGNPSSHYMNIDQIQLGGGLMNGDVPSSIYGLYQAAGANQTSYGKSERDQYTIKADFSLDIGKHSLKFGLQYEQRTIRGISYNANGLWTRMRDLTNFHILQLDKSNPIAINHGGQIDTIIYNRKYDGARQQVFDKSLRAKLGLPVDGLDFIVVDSYDYEAGTIDYYDKNGSMHTVDVGQNLFNIGMFSPDELWNDGNSYINYFGYDYKGNKLTGQPSFADFFNNKKRLIGAFRPIYMAGYIQDKFAFNDLIFNIGVRVDRFDANQKVLKDPYLLFPAKTVSEVKKLQDQPVSHPSNMGANYVVYVDQVNNPSRIVGYRNGNTWYNSSGVEIQDPSILDVGSGISPMLENPDNKKVGIQSFKDYDPQINVMPRISFSFPISDEALFFAHYDVLTQRPNSNVFSNPAIYKYFNVFFSDNNTKRNNNPSLEPTKTIDYELGFTQKLTNSSSLSITSFYKEMRNLIQLYRFNGAYPNDYTSYSNLDFGTVKGMTVEYDLRRTRNLRLRAAYTLQFADATGASTTTAASLIASGLPNLRSTYPMPWDRRHQFNIVLDYRYGNGTKYYGPRINRDKKGKTPIDILANTGFNLTVTGGSGTPYTTSLYPLSPISGGENLLRGSYSGSRLPWQFRLDIRIDKDIYFKIKKGGEQKYINVYFQILNMLNTQNAINVYPYTGNPNDDGYLSAPRWQSEIRDQLDPQSYIDLYTIFANSPFNYTAPRQIRFGFSYNF